MGCYGSKGHKNPLSQISDCLGAPVHMKPKNKTQGQLHLTVTAITELNNDCARWEIHGSVNGKALTNGMALEWEASMENCADKEPFQYQRARQTSG